MHFQHTHRYHVKKIFLCVATQYLTLMLETVNKGSMCNKSKLPNGQPCFKYCCYFRLHTSKIAECQEQRGREWSSYKGDS